MSFFTMVIEDPKTHYRTQHRCVNFHPVHMLKSGTDLCDASITTYLGASKAIKAGWRYIDKVWYCPRCAPEKMKEVKQS